MEVTNKNPKNIIFELTPKQIGSKELDEIIQPPQIPPKHKGKLKSLYRRLFSSALNGANREELIRLSKRIEYTKVRLITSKSPNHSNINSGPNPRADKIISLLTKPLENRIPHILNKQIPKIERFELIRDPLFLYARPSCKEKVK